MFHYHFKQQFAEISSYFDKTKNPDGLNQLSEISFSKELENIYDQNINKFIDLNMKSINKDMLRNKKHYALKIMSELHRNENLAIKEKKF